MSSRFHKKSNQPNARRGHLVDELQFLGQMVSTETALFHQRAAEAYGMGITDTKAISVLIQEGPMTAGQLATRLSLTTGAVTNLLDRLEEKHLVKRGADPQDRRKVIVQINTSKIEAMRNLYEPIGEAFEKLTRTYSEAELEFLVRYYRDSIELTKQEIGRLRRK